jgi:ATP-dependent DNA helicase RecQ
MLWKRGIAGGVYHAGLTHEQRQDSFKRWMKGEVRVMCATNAFGMGIDKPDVRLVLHADVPAQPEAYYQEAGRAGRDGLQAHAVLLWNESDIQRAKKNHELKFPPIDKVRSLYRALGTHLQLAIGAGKDQVFPVDFAALAKLTDSKPAEVLPSLQLLSLSGVLHLDEGSYMPSRMMVTLGYAASFTVRRPGSFSSFASFTSTSWPRTSMSSGYLSTVTVVARSSACSRSKLVVRCRPALVRRAV